MYEIICFLVLHFSSTPLRLGSRSAAASNSFFLKRAVLIFYGGFMLERVGDLFASYCVWVFSMVGAWIERTHGVVGVGLPALGVVVMSLFFPVWVQVLFAVLVVAPCVAALGGIVAYGLSVSGRR